MTNLIRFIEAYDYASRHGLVVRAFYSYDDFCSEDWYTWYVVPGETMFDVSVCGITVDGTFYPWDICGGVSAYGGTRVKHGTRGGTRGTRGTSGTPLQPSC